MTMTLKLFLLYLFAVLIHILLIGFQGFGYFRDDLESKKPEKALVDCDRREISQPCEFINFSKASTILLLGDSTAGNLIQVLYDVSREHRMNLVVFTQGGCQSQYFLQNKKSVGICDLVNSSASAYIKRAKPRFVIISNSVTNLVQVNSSVESGKRISKIAGKVLMVGAPPKFPDGNQYGKSGSFFSTVYQAPKEFSIQSFSHGFFIDKTYNQLAKANNLSFKSIFTELCDHDSCKRFVNGKWIYYDSDHLNTFGTYLLRDALEKFLES